MLNRGSNPVVRCAGGSRRGRFCRSSCEECATKDVTPAPRKQCSTDQQQMLYLCTPVRVARVRPLRAVNERPLIAAVPIGHRDDATALPASPPASIAVSPSLAVPPEEPKAIPAPLETSVVEATPPDAAPDAGPTPPASMPTVKKPRAQHAQTQARARRRNHYSYASSYSARSSSYSMSNTYVD